MLARRARYIAPIALLALAVGGGVAAGAQMARSSAVVKTAPARVLTNAKGMTLYVFAADQKNKSTCYGDCTKYWPPATVPAGSSVLSSMAGVPGAFGVIKRTDGKRQLTYDGAPLYTWANDKKPGDMTGQGVAGVWWAVAIPSASALTGPTGSPTATVAPSGSLTPTQTPDSGATLATPTPSGGYHGGGY